jgi:hypothetical protein
MNRRELLKYGVSSTLLGASSRAFSAPPKFSKVKLKKNVVLVTVDLGLYEKNFHEGKEKCRYFSRFFQDLKDDVTYFNGMSQPGIGGGHEVEHATFTTLRFQDRDLYPNRNFISLDQHLAEYALQETRHKSIYHKVIGGRNVSFNSLAQPAPSFNGINKLHEDLFGHTDLGKVKQDIAKQRFILKEIYNNTKRRWKGTQEERDLVSSIDYKIDDLDSMVKWLKVRKPKMSPKFDENTVERAPLKNVDWNFNTVFHALEKEQTKVALIQFGGQVPKGLSEISHGYHTLSHHAYYSERVDELETIDSYILKGLSKFVAQLKEAEMLDDTIVLFTCGMADANKHSSRNIPAFLFGGGFKHQPNIECAGEGSAAAIPTTHLYSSILRQAGFSDASFSGNKEIIKELF